MNLQKEENEIIVLFKKIINLKKNYIGQQIEISKIFAEMDCSGELITHISLY